MINKFNLRYLILPVLVSILFVSCKKDANDGNQKEKLLTNAVSIENGYLKFRDQKAFDSLVNILVRPENFNSRPREFANFKSYKDILLEIEKEYANVNTSKAFDDFKNKYLELVEIKSDSSLTYKFGTPLSALFINIRGEVKVGDFNTVYTKDHRMVSYSGKYKNEQEVNNIRNTNAKQGVFVSEILKNTSTAKTENTYGPTTTTAIKSELYYNEDSKRRLFVDLWKEATPRTDGSWSPSQPQISIIHYYFTSRQELKKTFGGWRTNETDYYFSNLNYTYTYEMPPSVYPGSTNFNLVSYSVPNATGPIIIDLGTREAVHYGISGTGRFFTGGVPNAPSFNVN